MVISYQMVFHTLCHTMNQTILDLEKIFTTSNISVKTFILFYFILFLKEYFFFFHLFLIVGGLENSMDRGAWQATVHGVTKSWT